MISSSEKLRMLIEEVSPLIEQYTREVCPGCTEVCCAQRHAVPDAEDLRFFRDLGADIPELDHDRTAWEPCQFLGPAGCGRPRWMRPFRCTWYFCAPLLRALEDGPARRYRQLVGILGEIATLRSAYGAGTGTV